MFSYISVTTNIYTMKKIFISLALTAIAFGTFAQETTDAGKLSAMPEYISAQHELKQLSIQWQKEIEAKYSEIGVLSRAYNTDLPSLSESTKKERKNAIEQKQQEVRNLQTQRFGINGDLYKKREVLLKPLQDKLLKEAESSY